MAKIFTARLTIIGTSPLVLVRLGWDCRRLMSNLMEVK